VETSDVELDDAYAAAHPGARPGHHVLLAVSDTGCGMDAPTRARIFEPFFTTKEAGRGTGLGLSTVYGIVQQTGGSIHVYSEVGSGTTFKIYLPLVGEPPVTTAPEPAPAPRACPGAERVLLVEDEDAVRELAREILESAGYTVVTAPNGREAVVTFGDHEGAFDLLLTDLVMPQMDGRRLAERLHERRPELRVLYMSGYADQAVVRHALLDPALAFLQKPFTVSSLTRRVREVLDSA
jgi:CheY-like chemotaxis protein